MGVPEAALEKKHVVNDNGEERANGDALKVTGSGAIYIDDPGAFIASKRVQETISRVNEGIERAKGSGNDEEKND